YNDMGEATRAVLEPRTVDVPGPYIEVETPKVTKITNWNKAAQGTVLVAKATEGTAKVALVVPFVGQTMAQAVADVGLVPA
ncbi:MAG: hypothetical protein HGA90_06230, partial [Alphaproteobacteria bacterium]|nr:hypothetical protein [Alphaproteobacteria bacterium]